MFGWGRRLGTQGGQNGASRLASYGRCYCDAVFTLAGLCIDTLVGRHEKEIIVVTQIQGKLTKADRNQSAHPCTTFSLLSGPGPWSCQPATLFLHRNVGRRPDECTSVTSRRSRAPWLAAALSLLHAANRGCDTNTHLSRSSTTNKVPQQSPWSHVRQLGRGSETMATVGCHQQRDPLHWASSGTRARFDRHMAACRAHAPCPVRRNGCPGSGHRTITLCAVRHAPHVCVCVCAEGTCVLDACSVIARKADPTDAVVRERTGARACINYAFR